MWLSITVIGRWISLEHWCHAGWIINLLLWCQPFTTLLILSSVVAECQEWLCLTRVTLMRYGVHKVSCYFFIKMFFTNKYWKGKIDVTIPRFINDYNLWMGGVDQAGQLIAYYLPDMRCHQNCLPIFIHSLSTIRVNSFIVYKHTNSEVKGKRGYTGK